MSKFDHSIWKSQSVVLHYLGRKDSRPFLKEQIDVMVRLIQNLCRPVKNFLDIGCGDGVLAFAIAQHFRDATAVLLDHSAPMLDKARANAGNMVDSIHFCNADYSDPKWTDAVASLSPFDLVVSGYSIHHQPDDRKREIYSEIFHMLEPGGMFINMEHVASPTESLAKLWDEIRIDSLYDSELQQGSGRERAMVQKEYYDRPDREANLFTLVDVQCEWLRKIGYVNVDCFFKYFELAVFGGCRP